MQAYLIKNVLISFDDDAENILLNILIYFSIMNTYICDGYPKLKYVFGFWSHRQRMFDLSAGTTLQDDVIANFLFQSVWSYRQRLKSCKNSLQIFMDRLCRLTASLQNQSRKSKANIFEAADHQISTRTLELYADLLKQLYLWLHHFLTICWQKSCGFNAKLFCACCRYKPDFYFFFLLQIKMNKQQKFIF